MEQVYTNLILLNVMSGFADENATCSESFVVFDVDNEEDEN